MRNDIINNILDLIGDTPLYKIVDDENKIYLKLEKYNLSGSIKDRAAKEIIIDYIEKKQNQYNGIICVTSFNLGLSLAILCEYYNINLILLMNNKKDYIKMKYFNNLKVKILNYSSKTYTDLNIIADSLSKRLNFYNVNQFKNDLNIKANVILASEINKDIKCFPDYIFCGIGSGGTLGGLKKYFDHDTTFVGVTSIDSDNIAGFNSEFIPYNIENINFNLIKVSYSDALYYQKVLVKKYGISVGLSTGAIFYSINKFIKDFKIKDKIFVCIAPDGMDRYLDE